MSRRVADLLIKIGADSYEFQQKTKQVERSLEGLGKKLTGVGKTLSTTLTLPLTAMGAASIAAADTQLKAEAKVQQAILSTNKAAGLSFDELKKYASELQSQTLFGDEYILNNATAQLLTFTNIAGDNFKRTQAVALDLATVLDGDVKSASIQLGKALNDPVKNLSALSRSGIQFSDEQKTLINTLAKTNRLGEAQSVILDELERQYGGQAKAAAQVGAGAFKQLMNQVGDLGEQFGMVLLPYLKQVVKWVSEVVGAFQNLSPTMQHTIVIVAAVAASIGPVLTVGGKMLTLLPKIKSAFSAMTSPIGLVTTALVALAAAFITARMRQEEFQRQQAQQHATFLQERKDEVYNRTYNEYSRPIYSDDDLRRHQRIAKETWEETKASFEQVQGGAPLNQNQIDALEVEKQMYQAITDVLAQRKRAAEDAAAMQKNFESALGSTTDTAEEADGLIVQLQKQIETLESSLASKKTVEEIAATNAEIETLREELERLQNISPEDLAPVQQIEPLVAAPMEITLPAPTVDLSGIARAVSESDRQLSEIYSSVRNGLYGWADETSGYLATNIGWTVDVVEEYTSALTAKGWSFSSALEHVSQTIASTMQRFDQQVSQFLSDSIVAAADALGQVIAGDLGFGDMLDVLLTQFASFLKNIGSQLIEFGVMILGFKSALKSVLSDPWAAIGIGVAMVAAAAYMTSLINKDAQESVPALATGGLAYGKTLALVGDNPNAVADPEVIAPLSKLQAMLPSGGVGQNIKLTLGGQLTAKGRDLVYVLGKENFKTSILGG